MQTKKEIYLERLAGGEEKNLPQPLTREEYYLYNLCKGIVDEKNMPLPVTNCDRYLEYICKNGGIGGKEEKKIYIYSVSKCAYLIKNIEIVEV